MRAVDAKVNLLLEMGRTQQAIDELLRVESMDIPKQHPLYDVKAHLIGRLAISFSEAGRKKEGLETIQKLLADVPPGSPAEASAWLDAGVVYKQSSMPDDALKAFDKAIELSQKLARSGRRPVPPLGPGGRPPGPDARPNPPKGDIP
jgi:tetratricopeptide (TPR) repeat protein